MNSSEISIVDDDGVNISVREITEQEKELLKLKQKDLGCHNSNAHIWKLDVEIPNVCVLFSHLNVDVVALGGEHVLVLTSDKRIFSYGSNTHGQLGVGDTNIYSDVCFVNTLQEKNIKSISCGARHNAVVCQDGSIYCWGDSRQGQCGVGSKGIFTTPIRVCFPPLSRIGENRSTNDSNGTKIEESSCGELFTVVLDLRGALWSWGAGSGLGHGKEFDECISPMLIKGLRHKKAIGLTCGAFHCIAITQHDYEGASFNVPSPDYRTSSISSVYYSELMIQTESSASKIPFLQSTFYSSGKDDDTTLRRSHSDTEMDVHTVMPSHQNGMDEASSVSEVDLRFTGESIHEKLTLNMKVFNRSLIDLPESMSSSQYYSAVDVREEDGEASSCNSTPLAEENKTFEKDNIEQIEKENASAYASNQIPNINDNQPSRLDSSAERLLHKVIDISSVIVKMDDDRHSTDGIFNGRKSLFDENEELNRSSLHLSNTVLPTTSSRLIQLRSADVKDCETITASTHIWSWGKNSYGQLGYGDLNDRLEPTMIENLSGKGILQVTAGAYHSLALTIHGQVYSWGDNTFSQLALSKSLVPSPEEVKVLAGIRVWDVAAGRNFSLFLGDSERTKTDVYFCGDGESKRFSRSMSAPVIEISSVTKKRSESRWRLSRKSSKRNQDSLPPTSFVDIQVRKLVHFEKEELVRTVKANDYAFACITEKLNQQSDLECIYKFARGERLFHQQLAIIQKNIIEPLIQTESWLNITKLIGGEALIPLVDSFVDLLNGISSELAHLNEIIRLSLSSHELFSYIFSDSFRAIYERYSKCYSDALAVGHLHSCNKPASNMISKLKDIAKDLEKHFSLTHVTFESLLKAPLMRAHVYCDIAKRISVHFKNKAECEPLKQVISRWLSFSDMNTKRLISAGVTYKFWNECHTKLIEALKHPQRRVLKTSKHDPLNLSRASRLSSHSYILCNDVFVHVQFNRNFQVFPLITLWADSVTDCDQTHNSIKITSPEESFVLSAGTPDGKVAWLKSLNQAIASCLSACSSHSLDIADVNDDSGLLTAAVAREASYTYVNHSIYKSARYVGMWMSGVPHGRGKMTWDDGSRYEGEFVNGLFHGSNGQMVWPRTSPDLMDKVYDGEWFEGNMSGHGRMRYGNNEEYIGHFKDGMRDGHGTLKCSQNKTSLDTVYVGDWVNDMKSGYGVLDYVIRGEKYMGMWVNDQRHNHGVVVTVDGVYYEGKFFQNRLTGKGILLSEDETCYEGEFTADMLLSGKGVLTLPNGDFIDGTFYGNWGESIKVNGVFSKFTNPLHHNVDNPQLGTTDFTIDADMKWQSLFNQCLISLGCHNNMDIEPEVAWKNVSNSILKAAGSLSGVSKYSSTKTDIEIFRKTDYKAQMGLANNLKGLEEHLSQAFDTVGHPLHTLVEGLVDVYRATYVGVGAHRRLLPHAVAEAKSYVSRLFNVLRVLFPDLHNEDFVLLSNDTLDGVAETPINSMSLLHPLLLPPLYPPLFTLYALQTEKTDALYTEKLYYLNKRGDIALLSFLGIKRMFWLLPDESHTEQANCGRAYMSAIETLESISTNYSPMGKIEIIRRTFAKIHEEIENHYKGVRQVLAMDDLFPLFQYIVIRARVAHLGSEIRFIEDLVDSSVLVGESGHMVTTLSACYFQIQNERDRD